MKTSIKTKLSILVAGLIIVILGANAGLLIKQKNDQGKSDLQTSAVSYSSLSHKVIGNAYALYGSSGFLNLKNIVSEQLEVHPDVTSIQIIDYSGNILFKDTDKVPKKSYKKVEKDLLRPVQGRFDVARNVITGTDKMTVIYPYYDDFDNHTLSMKYEFSYERIQQEIKQTIIIIGSVTLAAIILAIIVGIFFAGTIVKPLKTVMRGARKIAKGEYTTQISVHSSDETKDLADTFNAMAKDLYSNTEELKVKERLQEEMALAGKIQQTTIPEIMPSVNGIEFTASVKPAEDVGGDVYDFIQMSPNKVIGYLGDATGHGIPAGLIVAIANALIYHFATDGEAVAAILTKTNKTLYQKSGMDMFITMALFGWDAETKKLSLAMAGHEQILSFDPDTKGVELLKPGGMAVGMVEDIGMITKEEEIEVKQGQVLAIYSDGIPEAWAPGQKEIYGMDPFMESFKKHCLEKEQLQDIHDAVIDDAYAFMDTEPQQDDVTLMLIRFDENIKADVGESKNRIEFQNQQKI